MINKIIVIFSTQYSTDENEIFVKHIRNTIGCNSDVHYYINNNEFSLPQVYNKAIDEWNEENSIMVFIHHDIEFKSKDWGYTLLKIFNKFDYQIIGVAGSVSLPKSGVWWEDRGNMVGVVEHTDGINTWVSEFSKEKRGKIMPTVLVDGLFIAVDCNNIEHRFDEEFKGFHLYDLSFCIPNWLDGCNIGVTTDIRILHKSVGVTNDQWEENRKQFVVKYSDELPASVTPPYIEHNIKLNQKPKVTVIIPTKNNLLYIINNLSSWKNIVKYDNYEIIIADTGSDENVINQYNHFLNEKIRLVKYDYYNFAKINNDVVLNHVSEDTELILFCNDDIVLLNDALSRCVDIYNKNMNNVGTIGIRLHYADSSIQHTGIAIYGDDDDNIVLTHRDIRKINDYDMGVVKTIGNTGAFLLIRKELFKDIGCFNEKYIECFEDVELNLQCILRGKKNITVCDAVAYHFESVSREKTGKKLENEKLDYWERINVFFRENLEELNKYFKKTRING